MYIIKGMQTHYRHDTVSLLYLLVLELWFTSYVYRNHMLPTGHCWSVMYKRIATPQCLDRVLVRELPKTPSTTSLLPRVVLV